MSVMQPYLYHLTPLKNWVNTSPIIFLLHPGGMSERTLLLCIWAILRVRLCLPSSHFLIAYVNLTSSDCHTRSTQVFSGPAHAKHIRISHSCNQQVQRISCRANWKDRGAPFGLEYVLLICFDMYLVMQVSSEPVLLCSHGVTRPEARNMQGVLKRGLAALMLIQVPAGIVHLCVPLPAGVAAAVAALRDEEG